MTVENLLEPGTASIVSAVTSVILTIMTFYFKWLIGSFKKLEQSIDKNGTVANEIQAALVKMIDTHETKDQTRHEENLYRFERISVALAKMGSDNGTHKGKL